MDARDRSPAIRPPQPRLLDQVRDAIRRRHYGYRIEQAYVHGIERFIYSPGIRHPGGMRKAQVTPFLIPSAGIGTSLRRPGITLFGDPSYRAGDRRSAGRLDGLNARNILQAATNVAHAVVNRGTAEREAPATIERVTGTRTPYR